MKKVALALIAVLVPPLYFLFQWGIGYGSHPLLKECDWWAYCRWVESGAFNLALVMLFIVFACAGTTAVVGLLLFIIIYYPFVPPSYFEELVCKSVVITAYTWSMVYLCSFPPQNSPQEEKGEVVYILKNAEDTRGVLFFDWKAATTYLKKSEHASDAAFHAVDGRDFSTVDSLLHLALQSCDWEMLRQWKEGEEYLSP